MLKHIPLEGLDFLLALYNKIWQQRSFPEEWLEFTIMLKVTLLDFFDQKGTLSTLQCGGRAKRTTIDHLLSLEATKRKAQTNIEQVVLIFFEMKKTYDLSWRQSIMMDLSKPGLEVKILNFIQNFLKLKSFEVKFNENLSDTKILTEDMPQRSVVNPIYFLLKINKIVVQVPNDDRFQISLYMDGL